MNFNFLRPSRLQGTMDAQQQQLLAQQQQQILQQQQADLHQQQQHELQQQQQHELQQQQLLQQEQQPPPNQPQHFLNEQQEQQAIDLKRYNEFIRQQRAVDRAPALCRTHLEGIKPFSGKKTELAQFIKSVEKILPEVYKLEPLEASLRFDQIQNKLTGAAHNVLSEEPETWEDLRKLLIRAFGEKRNLGTLRLDLQQIQFQGTIESTFQAIQAAMKVMIDKISLRPEDPTKSQDKETVKHDAYMHFRNIIPQACIAALTARLCNDMYTAMEILDKEQLLELSFSDHELRNKNRMSVNQQQKKNFNSNNYRRGSNNFSDNSRYQQDNAQNQNHGQNNNSYQNNGYDRNSGYFARNSNNYRNPPINNADNSRQYTSQNNPNYNRPQQYNNNNNSNNSGNSRQTVSRHNPVASNNYPDSGMNRVHEPMVHYNQEANFPTPASEQVGNCHSSDSRDENI